VGVAIDPAARKIYWANWRGNKISYANLDGSGGGDLTTPGATVAAARSAVLLKAPLATGAPALTGGSSAATVLTCSPGSWAPDLLGSWLYRVPQRVSYSWTRDGADIPGASGRTYSASQGGDYRCRVIASNPAGSSAQTSAPHRVSAAAGGPGGGGVGGSGSPSPAAFGTKTRVSLMIAKRRIRGRGPVRLVVSNENPFKVAARLSVRATKRRSASRPRSFAVAARTTKTVAVKLSKGLTRGRKLSLRLALQVTDPAGHTRTVTKSVVLRVKTG
jgi:hypothetical protein